MSEPHPVVHTACAELLVEANGTFVPMRTLFEAAYQIDSQPQHVRMRSDQFYSDRFRPWLVRYLSPAVQFYVNKRGVARMEQTQVFFYMCPLDAQSCDNMKASYHELLKRAE